MLWYTYLYECLQKLKKTLLALFGKENAWEADKVRESVWHYLKV